MKKLALMLPAMRTGGAEKVALNFLPHLQKYFDVTLVLNQVEGELLNEVESSMPIVEDRLLDYYEILKEDLRHIRLTYLFKDFLYYIRVKSKWNQEENYRYLINRTPALDYKFDVAISYVANVSTQIFSIIDRTNADVKIAWIHGETTQLKDTNLFQELFVRFDKIFVVSAASAKHFIERFPMCATKTEVFYNYINKDIIIKKAEEPMDISYSDSYINIVSVGRLSPEKGFDMIPEIVFILKKKNYNVRWYIIGEGPVRKIIEEKKRLYSLDNNIFCLGNKKNPYPYIKNCDIYVQPSYEEGYSTTICEAGILGKAIVGTKTSGGIREQISDGTSGLLADPTPQDLAKKIDLLIKDKELKSIILKNIKKTDFSHDNEIHKLSFLTNKISTLD